MDIRKSVSIIIPNYNGKYLLEQYLPYTLKAIRNSGAPFELIVIDDCSTDNSIEFIKSFYPEIILICNAKNKGFSYTCNQGIQAAKFELIFLLNSDVKLNEDYFEYQWKYFEHPDTFGVMGRIIDMEGERIQDAARLPKWNGFKLKTASFYYSESKSEQLYTLYLSGANALINADKLKALGGFNEIFSPFYCEDMDLSIMAWRLNWKCYYEHEAICRHQVSASTKDYAKASWIKSVYFRNRFYFHAIHLDGFALFAWYLQITVFDFLPKILIGHFWILKSYFNLIENQKAIKNCKSKNKALFDRYNANISVFNVVEKIIGSTKNKTYIRLNP